MTLKNPQLATRFLWAMGGAQAQLIGRKVKNRREAKGWRPEDLAHETGIGMRTISRIEAGTTERMRLETAKRLAASLDLSIEELRPPEPEDDQRVEAQLAEVLARLTRIELALGVEAGEDDEEAALEEPAAIAEELADEVQRSGARTRRRSE